MATTVNACAIVLVGCLWGCTNPLLRQASLVPLAKDDGSSASAPVEQAVDPGNCTLVGRISFSIRDFRQARLYLPYLCNQLGSLVFYFVLSRTNVSLAGPACNGLSLVFSMATSNRFGERVDKPYQALLGAALVMAGVAVCLAVSPESSSSR